MKSLAAAAIVAIASLTLTSAAQAQTESRFAIGANLLIGASTHADDQDRAHTELYPELLWRFGDIQPGWGPHWGLDWYEVSVDRPVGGTLTTLGDVHVRPILGGYGYTWLRGKDAISANVLAGYAFGSIKMDSGLGSAYQNRLGVQVTDAQASNTFVFRPEIDFWHDINHLFGLNVNIGYMVARPDITITTSTGIDKRTARADQFELRVGLVYSIF